MEEWIEIVSSHNRDEAFASFEKWKKENQEWYNCLHDDEIRLRIIRTKEKKTLFSYRVRRITREQG